LREVIEIKTRKDHAVVMKYDWSRFYSKVSNFLSRDAGIPALVNLKVSPTSSLKKWVIRPSLNFEFDVTIMMFQEVL
jgi:hypothetical protein